MDQLPPSVLLGSCSSCQSQRALQHVPFLRQLFELPDAFV